jgi:hypothetical protein
VPRHHAPSTARCGGFNHSGLTRATHLHRDWAETAHCSCRSVSSWPRCSCGHGPLGAPARSLAAHRLATRSGTGQTCPVRLHSDFGPRSVLVPRARPTEDVHVVLCSAAALTVTVSRWRTDTDSLAPPCSAGSQESARARRAWRSRLRFHRRASPVRAATVHAGRAGHDRRIELHSPWEHGCPQPLHASAPLRPSSARAGRRRRAQGDPAGKQGARSFIPNLVSHVAYTNHSQHSNQANQCDELCY